MNGPSRQSAGNQTNSVQSFSRMWFGVWIDGEVCLREAPESGEFLRASRVTWVPVTANSHHSFQFSLSVYPGPSPDFRPLIRTSGFSLGNSIPQIGAFIHVLQSISASVQCFRERGFLIRPSFLYQQNKYPASCATPLDKLDSVFRTSASRFRQRGTKSRPPDRRGGFR